MKDVEIEYAEREDIATRTERCLATCTAATLRPEPVGPRVFLLHKSEYRVDLMEADPEAIARMATKALVRMAEEAAQDPTTMRRWPEW